MSQDWQDALKSLLPEGYVPEPEEESSVPTTHRGKLRIEVDRKGRKGKVATIISGFEGGKVEEVAAMLKRKLGVGGSCRADEILVQGDRAAQSRKILEELGYSF